MKLQFKKIYDFANCKLFLTESQLKLYMYKKKIMKLCKLRLFI